MIDDAIPRERAVANSFPEHPHGMEVFAAWLKRNSADRLRAMVALIAAQDQSATARTALAAARSAARAVERVIEERASIARAEADKRDQHTLDDITRRLENSEERWDDAHDELG